MPKIEFQVLDCDYIFVNGKPKIRIFGKDRANKTVCVFYTNFLPYFYILPKVGKKKEVIEFLKSNFSNLIWNIEEVEKYLPIGYSEKKQKLIKITLKDPKKVPKVRDSLNESNLVKETFEADILFRYRFMADFNISGLHWYSAEGNFVQTNSVSTNKIIEASKFNEIKDEGMANLKYLAIDLEVATPTGMPDAEKDKISIISLAFSPPYKGKRSLVLVSKKVNVRKNVLSFENEKKMLQELIKIFDEYDPDFVVGYNINDFDLPFLITRLKHNKISPLLGRAKDKPASSRAVGAKRRNSIPGRIVVDVYELIKEFALKGAFRLKRYGLGDVAKELINEGKVDVAHSEIYRLWNGDEKDVKKLIDYAEKDAELTLRILIERNLLDKFIEISKVCGLLLQDVLDSGEAARIENLLLREFNKRGFIIPNKPDSKEISRREAEKEAKELKGALVFEPKTGLHFNVIYLDFKAMYPSIFIYYNICPTTFVLRDGKDVIKTPYGTKFVSKRVREGIIPQIISKLIEERDKVKKLMRITEEEWEKRMLDAKQYALKIMANAFYGYMGYLRARFYILDIANAITSCGREIISKTRKIIEENGKYSVIYGDTDSVMVDAKCKNIEEAFKEGRKVEELVNEKLKEIVKMKIEGIFKSLLVLSKKRYAGIAVEKVNDEYKEKIVMKGIETVRRDWCELTEETLYNVLNIILQEQNPRKAFDYVRKILEKLERNEIPIEKLVITKSITKPISQYKGIQPHIELVKKLKKRQKFAPSVGDRVGFVIISGPQLISKRAEDPKYVVEKKLKIDSKYYIESQILPPLERVFEVLGISKSQLIGFGKQMVLVEAMKNKKEKVVLPSFDEFVCIKCNTSYRRIPLSGKCIRCNGDVLFSFNGNLSKYIKISA